MKTCLLVTGLLCPCTAFDATAWQTTEGNMDTMAWPEDDYLENTKGSQQTGISLSGGGDRSYTASIGYLAAMHELDMMGGVTYLVGVSGGAWATTVYSYFQDDTVSDATMLGPVVFPEDISFETLGEIASGCVRSFVNSTEQLGGPTFEDWADFVQAIYLTPSNIPRGAPFSYSSDSVSDIKSRNPSLVDVSFVLPRGQSGSPGVGPRPYPIISTTLVGPYDMLPALPSNRNYTLLEFAPLSVGVAFSSVVKFAEYEDAEDSIFPIIGGLVEPFAFGGSPSPSTGLGDSESTGQLDVPSFDPLVTDLALASGSSSWAAGAAIAASDNPLVQVLSGTVEYWSPSAADPSVDYEEYVVADGAGVSNTNLISLLQRGVANIFAFVSTSVPMQNSTHWNPAEDPLSKESIDFTVSAWFGQMAEDLSSVDMSSYDLNNSHVFEPEEWIPFATALQAAQAVGKGNVISMKHVTVENPKYGIKAGVKVNVVWFYLGRCLEWEHQLNDEMKSLVVPEDDPNNQASLRKLGPFAKFPHYTTAVASLDNEQANLLADLAGWMIYQNQDLLKDIFSRTHSNGNDDDLTFAESTTGILVIVFSVSGIIIAVIAAVLVYRRYAESDPALRKDNSLASQDTFVGGRESELMSTFTGSILT